MIITMYSSYLTTFYIQIADISEVPFRSAEL